jgi:hypothetical protein
MKTRDRSIRKAKDSDGTGIGASHLVCDRVRRRLYIGAVSVMSLLLSALPAQSQGTITTFAGNGAMAFFGDGGQATAAALNQPTGLAIDSAGGVYIADYGNSRVRRVSPAGIISTAAGSGIYGAFGDGGPAISASFSNVAGIVLDSAGNLYIADVRNHRIRKVTPDGTVTAFAGTGLQGSSGDGGQAINATLNTPIALAIDAAGNLYICDSSNHNVRRVNLASGIITTYAGNGVPAFAGDGTPAIAAALMFPLGLATDQAGNLYIADAGNNCVRKVNSGGFISTAAGSGSHPGFAGDGGFAAGALLNTPSGVAVDGSGNLYISDSGNNRVRKVDGRGVISTVAGTVTNGFSGDGGSATTALLNYPWGIAVDAAGAIYVADMVNNRIRKIAGSGATGTTPPPGPGPTGTNVALGKSATQSSTLPGYAGAGAGSALDGITDGNFSDGSVTATNLDSNAWWQVDVGASTTISSIAIWNRTDCCGSRLNDYWVFVSDAPFSPTDTPSTLQFRAGTWASHQTSAPNPSTTIAASTEGRYVRVQLSGANYLSLAEVQVYGQSTSPTPTPTPTPAPTGINLAPGKSAAQSSTLPGYATAGAGSAVDGRTDGNFPDGSVTATNLDSNAWWQMDLGASASVSSIVVWNRSDCCGARLSDFWVFVSDTPFSPTDTPGTLQFRAGTWSSHQTAPPSPSTTIAAGAQGRYVRVQLTGADYLSLAEVQVFGSGGAASPTNVAPGKAATQSSTLPGYAAGATAAVDGSTDGNFPDGSVTATNADLNAWWQVDLGVSTAVSSIVVWNRTDCCGSRLGDYWVFVSDTPFLPTDTPTTLQFRPGTLTSHQTAAPNPSTTIAAGVQGRYVRVQLTGVGYLSLAEVQVFGQ